MTQKIFPMHAKQGHLLVEYCTKTALSDENSLDPTAYLPKQQPMSIYFPNALRI
jgi:hypothetical protein